MPSISVVIPTYNRCAFVADAIDSVFRQQCHDTEIIVVDDGSEDATREKVAPFVAAGAVTYVWQPNQGVSAARNRGIREASGEFVAFLDSDDLWTPAHLHGLRDALDRYRGFDVAFSKFRFVGCNSDADRQNASFDRSIREMLDVCFSKEAGVWLSNGRLLQGLLQIGFPFRIQGSLIRTALLRRCRLQFDEAVDYTEEAQFMIEAACHARFVYVDEATLVVRRHEGNTDDRGYGPKVVSSYEKRIRRLKELFGRTLAGEERRAFKHALCKMQSHIFRERAREADLRTTIAESARLLAEVPCYESVRAVARILLRRRVAGMPAGSIGERA
ncbi:MAG TPA: glycosyltransferase [Vicinamibacterales bacterium]|jgi:GT2 family glycosyltransferase